jgi:hypothetical protein
MAKQARVEIHLSLTKYTTVYADKLAQRVNVAVRIFAKQFVAVGKGPDGGRLRNSIQSIKLGFGEYQTFAATPYAAAQEYGLAPYGKPNYTFTPYMRPAADKASSNANLTQYSNEASDAAARIAKK